MTTYESMFSKLDWDAERMHDEDGYMTKMQEHKENALFKLSKEVTCNLYELEDYASCIANAFRDGCHYAKHIFKRLNLKYIDSSAILHQYNDFVQDYDQYQFEMRDYE